MADVKEIWLTNVFLQIELFMQQVFDFMMNTYIVVGTERFSLFNIGLGALAIAGIVKNMLPMFDGDSEYEMDEDVNEYFDG